MAIREILSVLGVKSEATEGTAETITSTEIVARVRNLVITPTVAMHDRPIQSASMSPYSSIPGSSMVEITFEMDLVGASSGANIQANGPEGNPLFKAVGFKVDLATSNQANLTPSSNLTDIPSCTLKGFYDGVAWTAKGCRGNLKIVCDVGKPFIGQFRMLGCYDSTPTDTAIPGNPPLQVPPGVFLLGAVTTHTVGTLVVQKVELDLGNDLRLREDANSAQGYKSCYIVNRRPTGVLTVETPAVATHPIESQVLGLTLGAFTMRNNGGTGNLLTISTPGASSWQYAGSPRLQSIGGVMHYAIPVMAVRTAAAGEDELKLGWS